MKTVLIALARRYASKIGVWGLVATATAAIFGVDAEAVRELLGPIEAGEKLTLTGILTGVATVVHWIIDKDREAAKEEGKSELLDSSRPPPDAGDDPGIVRRVKDFFDRDDDPEHVP